jgi:hypothetical protein
MPMDKAEAHDKVIDPKSDHLASMLWERAFQIFHLLM